MVLRNTFKGFFNHGGMRDGPKSWHVRLIDSLPIWFELAIPTKSSEFNLEAAVKSHLHQLKRWYADYSDRRFIYFICSRQRVRLAAKNGAHWSLLRRSLVLHLELGGERRKVKVRVPRERLVHTADEEQWFPTSVSSTTTSITLHFLDGDSLKYPIHELLRVLRINLGIFSRVEYIGYTENPETRPLNRSHRGLADTLYSAIERQDDVFVYYNTFQAIVESSNENYAVHFELSNAMIGEVDLNTEGRIIESAWIDYFKPDTQAHTMDHEEAKFAGLRKKLRKNHNIISLDVQFYKASDSDYFILYSNAAVPAQAHAASYDLAR